MRSCGGRGTHSPCGARGLWQVTFYMQSVLPTSLSAVELHTMFHRKMCAPTSFARAPCASVCSTTPRMLIRIGQTTPRAHENMSESQAANREADQGADQRYFSSKTSPTISNALSKFGHAAQSYGARDIPRRPLCRATHFVSWWMLERNPIPIIGRIMTTFSCSFSAEMSEPVCAGRSLYRPKVPPQRGAVSGGQQRSRRAADSSMALRAAWSAGNIIPKRAICLPRVFVTGGSAI